MLLSRWGTSALGGGLCSPVGGVPLREGGGLMVVEG